MIHIILGFLLVPANPVAHYVYLLFHRDPFRGIYQPNAFDLSIEIPYFLVLTILSVYGFHRYCLTYYYLKNRRKKPLPLKQFERLPRVTVQLPVYNEQYVVERLIEAAVNLDYPLELLEIQVLDDSTDDTRHLCARLVEQYAAAGYPIKCLHRENRLGFKAG